MKTNKIKIEHLTPNMLSYLMSIYHDPTLRWGNDIGIHHASFQVVNTKLPEPKCYSPFLNWQDVGKLIEKYHADIANTITEGGYRAKTSNDAWRAQIVLPDETKTFDATAVITEYGPTPIVAILRAIAYKIYGETADIPEEITFN